MLYYHLVLEIQIILTSKLLVILKNKIQFFHGAYNHHSTFHVPFLEGQTKFLVPRVNVFLCSTFQLKNW
jgi:hypothetical protein